MGEGTLYMEDNYTNVRAWCDSYKYGAFSLDSRRGWGLRREPASWVPSAPSVGWEQGHQQLRGTRRLPVCTAP